MKLIQYPQENCDIKIAEKIIALENTAWPQESENKIFPSAPNTYLTSFVLMENDVAVCHVGIRRSILKHKGEDYLAFGLSEVVTHPQYQEKGLASQTIRKATEFIISQNPDISIFTCAQERVNFYVKCGWEIMPGTCFIGGTTKFPFRSNSLNLMTMMMFLSPKSKQHKDDFKNTDLVFELGKNQLW